MANKPNPLDTPSHAQRAAEYLKLIPLLTGPHRDVQANASTQASEFAKMLVQAFVILHGGGLVAFPTLFQLVGVDFKSNLCAIITLAGSLIAGLICAFVAGISGFFASANGADGGMKMVESAGYDAWVWSFESADYEPELTEKKQKSTEAEAEADKYFRKYEIWRSVGIVAAIGSLVAFIAAAVIGLATVWQNA